MKFKSSLFVGAVALAATSLVAVSANADKLRWKMQSTWGSQVAINGEAAVYFSNKVKEISGGDVQLRFHEFIFVTCYNHSSLLNLYDCLKH